LSDNPTIGAGAILAATADTGSATLLDGTQVPLPPATPDQPAIGVLRQQAMGRIAELKGNEEFRRLLLSGNAEALAEVQRLEKIVKTPTGTFYGASRPCGKNSSTPRLGGATLISVRCSGLTSNNSSGQAAQYLKVNIGKQRLN
jgi:hypothetical protein